MRLIERKIISAFLTSFFGMIFWYCWFVFFVDAYGSPFNNAGALTMFSSVVIFCYGVPISTAIDSLIKNFRYPELGSIFLHVLAGYVFPAMSFVGSLFSIVFWLIDRGVEKLINKLKKN